VTLWKPGRGSTGASGARAAFAAPLAAATILLAACGSAPARPLVGAMALPQFDDPAAATLSTASPAPSPTAVPATDTTGGGYVSSGTSAPRYPLVAHLDAPTVNVHVPVVAVGIVRGAMDAPEGPLGSAFWREGFWLRQGAVPGTPGTATIAGHLDDTAGRPAAFWNIRNLHTGDEVDVTRASDGAVLRYRIVETDVWSISQANSKTNLARIYGSGGSADGVSRLTLITCTGRWTGTEYDHRFLAFAVLET
jgi:hypothetical protein